jgi:hypothetical protein
MQGRYYFEEYAQKLSTISDLELIEKFNLEVGNNGWGTARASYLAAIHQEFNRRGFDYSQIGNVKELSFKNKIELIEKVIKEIE